MLPVALFGLTRTIGRFAFGIVLAFICVVITSCSIPEDTEGATAQLIGQGLLHVQGGQRLGDLLTYSFGVQNLSQTQVVKSHSLCEGAIGSVIPPLAVKECVGSAITLLFRPLDELQVSASGTQYPENHVYLAGVNRFWVRQSRPNDCWAAALQIARDFLHLHHVSQDELIDSAQNLCPRLKDQPKGADVYQMTFSIVALLARYDIRFANPHFCGDAQCILASLMRDRPVIMLRSGHAVLIVGADFLADQNPMGPAPALVAVNNFKILDPAGTGEVANESPFVMCNADAFLAY